MPRACSSPSVMPIVSATERGAYFVSNAGADRAPSARTSVRATTPAARADHQVVTPGPSETIWADRHQFQIGAADAVRGSA